MPQAIFHRRAIAAIFREMNKKGTFAQYEQKSFQPLKRRKKAFFVDFEDKARHPFFLNGRDYGIIHLLPAALQ